MWLWCTPSDFSSAAISSHSAEECENKIPFRDFWFLYTFTICIRCVTEVRIQEHSKNRKKGQQHGVHHSATLHLHHLWFSLSLK